MMIYFLVCHILFLGGDFQDPPTAAKDKQKTVFKLGTNNTEEIPESSGLAFSFHVEDAVWTHNDSGHLPELFLLKTTGQLLARIRLSDSRNVDWEAMCRFAINDKSYLLVADVGDNQKNRSQCQLYVFIEPDLAPALAAVPAAKLPLIQTLAATKLEFTYEDGPRNCEAVAVDVVGKQIWLIEKIYTTDQTSKPPGVFVLPLPLTQIDSPVVAKRIANFPIRNVTGMAFSSDGKRLIVRNYFNAHLYSRRDGESWEEIVRKTRPQPVVMPLQAQGEAICFTPDSQSVIVTSEFSNQAIWQVNLDWYFERSREKNQTPSPPVSPSGK